MPFPPASPTPRRLYYNAGMNASPALPARALGALARLAPWLGLGALAFAFPLYHWWPVVWVALVPLLLRARVEAPRIAARSFLVGGYLFHILLLQWLMANTMWAGGWAFLGYLALCAALAVFWAPVGWAWSWAGARLPGEATALLLAVGFGVVEWCHANLFTGFGWSALGYSQGPDLAFAQLAAVGGVSLLSVIILLVNALLALAWATPTRRVLRVGLAFLLLLAAHGVGWAMLGDTMKREDGYRVGISQTNFPIEMKYDADYTEDMVQRAARESLALAKAQKLDLLVWPEAVVMDDFNKPDMLGPMVDVCTGADVALFAGSVRDDGGEGYNSSVLIGRDGKVIDHYDKVHLVPFGEYMPFAFLFPFMEQIVPSHASHGNRHKVLQADGPAFGPMICFESIYNDIAEELQARDAGFLVVITNLAWFGRSAAVSQELEFARFRAIETRLPLVHAANTGISGVFDPYGRFAHVSGVIRHEDTYYAIDPDRFPPEATIMQRMVGAFDLPAAANRPFAHGTRTFAMAYALIAIILLGLAARRAATPPPRA